MTTRPNVVFLMPDQMSARRLPVCSGDAVPMPNLDRLVAQSCRFDRCVSPCPVGTPARAMLNAGRSPQTPDTSSIPRSHA